MAAPTALASQAASSNAQLTRTLERLLEDAQHTGELKLNGRKLKELPPYAAKYDLRDIVHADLSKNRLSELPTELCGLVLLERLDCHSNVLRVVPPTVAALQALTYLDLSRNQLSALPMAVCQLPLAVLLVSSNRLAELPEELGRMRSLMDLDVSCNELSQLPPGIGELQALRSLRVRRNRLLELPAELCRLRLWHLDVSENQLARLPPLLRLMNSLRHLLVDGNPLVSPPAFLCRRGQVHVFKYLELEAVKEDRRRGHLMDADGSLPRRGGSRTPVDQRPANNGHVKEPAGGKRPTTIDSGYCSTSDVTESRWSFEAPEDPLLPPLRAVPREQRHERLSDLSLCSAAGGTTTPSTLSPCSETGPEPSPRAFFDDSSDTDISEHGEGGTPMLLDSQSNGPALPEVLPNHAVEMHNGDHSNACEPTVSPARSCKEAPPPPRRVHQQTYREFKEALRLQRLGLAPTTTTNHVTAQQQQQQPPPLSRIAPEEEFRVRHEAIVHQQRLEAAWAQQRLQQPPSPPSLPASPLLASSDGMRTPPRPSRAGTPQGGDFTIRRGLERAREEHDLIEQLRWVIESRLKVQLPAEIGPSLVDGVVLCHLANQVQPRSVASIHVPSAATPKLTLAKCRRNVENFLTACRQLGVPEGDLFAWEDLVLRVDMGRVAATVAALVPGHWLPLGTTGADRSLACLLLVTLAGTCLLLLRGWPPHSDSSDEWSIVDLWLPVGLCCGLYLHACLCWAP
ncbi:leucine-rich repeat and calponin homology domain-containing protein 1 isoform X1 [Dermacentor andersoni]|uniref:leucine-rich repeat and calponin homology domain-containing protein 1 isoform X1 n=1 Tax=Dermacentor andersoni TaxID=34620 RepID=UPI002155AFA4|nr:leucine-rich repeat and calponin homology domain-containing protein-like isoform X1 [Dermacentor andersoni]